MPHVYMYLGLLVLSLFMLDTSDVTRYVINLTIELDDGPGSSRPSY